jgi:hypothetical protein
VLLGLRGAYGQVSGDSATKHHVVDDLAGGEATRHQCNGQ